MATPGYPQHPQHPQHPMMGGPMMGGPMGAAPPPRGGKRGVSKAVPVVVSAGLAVGVFCGLLFGLGTGDQTAHAEPSKGNNVKAGATDDTPPPPTTPTPAPPPKTAGGVGSGANGANPVAASTGSNTPATTAAATGSGTGSGSAQAAAANTAKLTIEVEPDAAASIAKIAIDGKEITGTSIDLPADKKSVKVSVTATGFHSVDKKVDVTGGSETKVQLEMTKRATGGGSPGFGGSSSVPNKVPTASPKPKKPANSGIIDI